MPVRNDPRRLRRCLAAVARSTYRDFEVIVADDASTDDTATQAESAAQRLQQPLRVVRLPRQSGPAAARNAAVNQTRAELLFFVDADVLLHRDALSRAVEAFDAHPEIDGLFGSYDTSPEHPGFISQFKNLSHHFVHQQAARRATTFWCGCGAMRRAVFTEAGGFDAHRYRRPCIEDIELGARLVRDGRRIVVEKTVQGTHLKRWTLRGLVLTDVLSRGIPWTRLILRQRDLPRDLNLGITQRISAVLAASWVLVWMAAGWFEPLLLALPPAAIATVWVADKLSAALGKRWRDGKPRPRVPMLRVLAWLAVAAWLAAGGWMAWQIGPWWSAALLLPLAGMMALNAHYYAFFVRERSIPFAAGVLPLHGLYYLYSGAALAAGIVLHVLRDRRTSPAVASEAPAPPAPVAAARRAGAR